MTWRSVAHILGESHALIAGEQVDNGDLRCHQRRELCRAREVSPDQLFPEGELFDSKLAVDFVVKVMTSHAAG